MCTKNRVQITKYAMGYIQLKTLISTCVLFIMITQNKLYMHMLLTERVKSNEPFCKTTIYTPIVLFVWQIMFIPKRKYASFLYVLDQIVTLQSLP